MKRLLLVGLLFCLGAGHPSVAPCKCGCRALSHVLCSSPACPCGCVGPYAYLVGKL